MFKKSINKEKSLGKILVIVIFISLVLILTLCTKKTTSPDEQLLAPSNLQISLIENNKIQLSWTDNSENETKFLIARKVGTFDWQDIFDEVEANITSFSDIIPTNKDTIYAYKVRAFDGEDYSAYSDTVAWFSESSAPTNLQLEQIAQDSIKLIWMDNSIGELNFRVDRKIGNADWQENYKILEPDTTSYIDYNSSLYDTCYYKVFATCGNSYSDSTQNYFIPFLPSPTNLQMEALSATSVKLTWRDNCNREDGYLVYKMEEGNDWDSTNIPANIEEWTDENVIPGIVNYYKVCAYIGDDHSGYIEDSLNTLPEPTNLQIEQLNVHTFKLDWQDNSNFEQGFKIDRKIDDEEWVNEIGVVDSNITTWTDSTVGRNYEVVYYKVYGYYEEYNSTKIESNSNVVFPAPTNLQIEQLSIYEIKLTWQDNSEGEEGFKIDRKIGSENWENNFGVVNANNEEWIDTEPVFDEINYYRVYAYAGNNYSLSVEGNLYNIIQAPSNLSAEPINDQSISLSWYDNCSFEEGYKVERKENGGSFSEIAMLGENTPSYIDEGLNYGTTYNYRVHAFLDFNESDYSNEVTIETIFPAPTNQSAILISDSEIQISWDDNCSFELGYAIERSDDGSEFTQIGEVFFDVTFYNDTGLNYGITYTYRVRAFTDLNYSNFSNEYSILLEIIAPTNLTATVVNEINIRLDWNDNSNIEEGYKIERKMENEDYELLTTVNQNVTSFTDVNVENLVTYYYRIYAYNQNYYSEYSNEANATCYKGMILVPEDYPTIQEAINIANYGDTVLVFPGTYFENVNYNGNCVTVASLFMITDNPNYISQTIIDGNQNGSVVTFESGEGPTALLTGFTITNGNSDEGGGIYFNDSSPILKNLIIKNNNTSYYGYGGGIYCNNYSSPHIENVILIGNSGGGLYCDTNSSPYLLNVTFTKNSYGICAYYDANPDLNNCILWDNGSSEISEYQDYDIDVYYSDIQGGWSGTGNIDANPQFINPAMGNYHLSPGSPCIDAGNPDPQYNDPDGSRNDMGAYGGPGGDW